MRLFKSHTDLKASCGCTVKKGEYLVIFERQEYYTECCKCAIKEIEKRIEDMRKFIIKIRKIGEINAIHT